MKFNKEALYDLIENETKLTKVGNRMVRKDCYIGYPSLVIDVIKSIGGKVLGDFDTNGWQYDYWITFILNEKRYTVEGTGYYGTVNRVLRQDIEKLKEEEVRECCKCDKLLDEASDLLKLAKSLDI